MGLTRRKFLKVSGGLTAFVLGSSLFDFVKVPEALADVGVKVGTETTTICCFCGCGCGAIVTSSGGEVINLEGDPTHPVNEGALCSKGLAMRQISTQLVSDGELATTYAIGNTIDEWPANKRLARVLYRPAGGTQWQILDWGTALDMIGDRVATTRKNTWEATSDDGAGSMTVNRTRAIAGLGGAAHDTEECHLLRKFFTGLGLVYIEHQARI